jgi:hypothetical protein
MLKNRSLFLSTGILVMALITAMTGCQKAPETAPDSFSSTYSTEEGRSFSISGNSDGMPGGQAEYMLKINNNAENWQDEYFILLVDSNAVIQEISHEQISLPGGGKIQKPIMIKYPEDYEGALGLCVMIPESGALISTLSIGKKDAVASGWPDIRDYPKVSR